ncbi:uncharacterized protein [Miscanthus floridulus]
MAAQLKRGIPVNCGVLALTAGQARPRPRAPPDMACSSSSLWTSTRSRCSGLPQDPGAWRKVVDRRQPFTVTKHKSTLQNNDSTQVAPIIEEEDETGGHENENEDGLQETQPGSVVTVQKGAPAPTRSTRSTAPPSRALFNENPANVTALKTYITSQQLMNRTRNNPKRRK